MRIFILLTILLTVPLQSCIQEQKHTNSNKIEYIYYKNGHLKAETIYNDSFGYDLYKEFYESGHLKIRTYLKETKKEGEYYVYYENGKIKAKENYIQNLVYMDQYEYYPDGSIKLYQYYSRPWSRDIKIEYDSLTGKVINSDGHWAPMAYYNSKSDTLKKGDSIMFEIHVIKPPKLRITGMYRMGFKDQISDWVNIDSSKNNPVKLYVHLNDTGGYYFDVTGIYTDIQTGKKGFYNRYVQKAPNFYVY